MPSPSPATGGFRLETPKTVADVAEDGEESFVAGEAMLVLARADMTVFRVVLSMPFHWTAPERIRLHLADGRTIDARLRVKGSTHSGKLPSGSVLRLVVEAPGLAARAGDIERIELAVDAGPTLVLKVRDSRGG